MCLPITPSTARSLKFPRSGSSSPTLMLHLLYVVFATARSSLKTRRELALENLALRQQLAIVQRKTKRPKLSKADRAFWVALCRLWPGWHNTLIIVKPETVIAGIARASSSIGPGRADTEADVHGSMRRS